MSELEYTEQGFRMTADSHRLWLKRANPDLFRIHQQTQLAGIPCTTLGNMFLYEYPLKAPLQCSRDLTQTEIDTRKNECLTQAANGIVSHRDGAFFCAGSKKMDGFLAHVKNYL